MTRASIPRDEHPRPEAVRDRWWTLNGPWEFELDPARRGLKDSWQARRGLSREIIVPFPFQSRLSGIGDTSPVDTAWYARSIDIPERLEDRRLLLQFNAVDHECTAFINGVLAGHHVGGVTPFTIDVTSFIDHDASDLRLALHVFDPRHDKGIPRGKQTTDSELHGCFYENVTGIWQPAWMEITSDVYLDREYCVIRADPFTGLVEASIVLAGDVKQNHVVEARVMDGKTQLSETGFAANLAPGYHKGHDDSFEIVLHVDPASIVPWSTFTPRLYTVEFTIIDGDSDDMEVLDTLTCTFGFRIFEVRGDRFFLNGGDIYLSMPLYQGYWVDGLWTAPSDEAIREDVELALEMGFNAMRLHQKLEDPRLLHWADRLGLMVWGEFANSFSGDACSRERFLAEWAAGVRRDRNHPAIIAWVPFNESWGTGDLNVPPGKSYMRSAYHLTRMLDPTRPVIDNDGWEHVETDVATIHDYIMPDGFATKYPVQPPDIAAFLRDMTAPIVYVAGRHPIAAPPVVLSEWGGWGMHLDDPCATPDPKQCWGYQGVLYKTFDEILELYDQFVDLLVERRGWIRGHCYTEFCDQYQEMNGFLTFDRRPKGDLARIKAINDKLLG